MSPAHVRDIPPDHYPGEPTAAYCAQLTCPEHPGWEVTWSAGTALAHLANLAELEDMAVEHNAAHHGAADPHQGREDPGTTDTTQRHERGGRHGVEDQRRAFDLP